MCILTSGETTAGMEFASHVTPKTAVTAIIVALLTRVIWKVKTEAS